MLDRESHVAARRRLGDHVGCCRRLESRIGYKIGPLFADNATLAQLLLDALVATVPDATVAIDIPEPNEAAAWAQRHGMTPVFETGRMYRGPAPKINLARVFGVTTLELG